jgi:hypothetical protein
MILCNDCDYGDIEPTGGKTIPTLNLTQSQLHDALYLFNEEEVVAVRTQRWKYLGKSGHFV